MLAGPAATAVTASPQRAGDLEDEGVVDGGRHRDADALG